MITRERDGSGIAKRLAGLDLRLHPDKTPIVYGKEALLGWLLSGDACKLARSSAQGLARSPAGYAWQEPMLARFVRKLSAFSRMIAFDKRGMSVRP